MNRLRVACLVLAGGYLPLQTSCGRIIESSITAGVGQAITATTTELLVTMIAASLELDIDPGNLPDFGNGGSDPFTPPVQR